MERSEPSTPYAAEVMPLRAEDTPAGTVLDALVDQIQEVILSSLEPGSLLPAESDLAARYGVSRLTVREAIKVLAGRGLIRSQRGRRPEVCQPDSRILSAHLTMATRRESRAVLELLEIRAALEVLAAGLAAQHVTRAGTAAIQAALDGMTVAAGKIDVGESDVSVLDAYNRADIAFHEALALASGNRMLGFVLEGLEGPLQHSFSRSVPGHVSRGGSFAEVVQAHQLILDRIRNGDSSGAQRAMRNHLRNTARDLNAAANLLSGVSD